MDYYSALDDKRVRCELCPHFCRLTPGQSGICRARENREGKILVKTAGRICSLAVDPIEKKPLYHFYPGAEILSLGSWGCNLGCAFCQNWEISQREVPTRAITPAEMAATARVRNLRLVAHTYNEPYVNFEFVRDCCRTAREAGLKNVMVSNGYWNPRPAEELLPLVDAVNLDLKAFSEDFYRRLCGGSLAPVLETISLARRICHVELTTLVIPGENDGLEEIAAAAKWIAENCGTDTPWHLSAYFPRYKMSAPPTPVETLCRARETARRHLRFVYVGNVAPADGGDNGANTLCPRCGTEIIRRAGYQTAVCGLAAAGACANCGEKLGIIN